MGKDVRCNYLSGIVDLIWFWRKSLATPGFSMTTDTAWASCCNCSSKPHFRFKSNSIRMKHNEYICREQQEIIQFIIWRNLFPWIDFLEVRYGAIKHVCASCKFILDNVDFFHGKYLLDERVEGTINVYRDMELSFWKGRRCKFEFRWHSHNGVSFNLQFLADRRQSFCFPIYHVQLKYGVRKSGLQVWLCIWTFSQNSTWLSTRLPDGGCPSWCSILSGDMGPVECCHR